MLEKGPSIIWKRNRRASGLGRTSGPDLIGQASEISVEQQFDGTDVSEDALQPLALSQTHKGRLQIANSRPLG
ncbi:MAG: hypothetical protein J5I65_06665 [Aridibacter famidurans]|nr:hypothetical protein [Aridibacter famidurans]